MVFAIVIIFVFSFWPHSSPMSFQNIASRCLFLPTLIISCNLTVESCIFSLLSLVPFYLYIHSPYWIILLFFLENLYCQFLCMKQLCQLRSLFLYIIYMCGCLCDCVLVNMYIYIMCLWCICTTLCTHTYKGRETGEFLQNNVVFTCGVDGLGCRPWKNPFFWT